MKLQGRNLSVNMIGEDVALLQKQLKRLGYKIPKPELQKRRYGKSTRQAVMAFQKENHLSTTGTVDKKTAAMVKKASENLSAKKLKKKSIRKPRDDVMRTKQDIKTQGYVAQTNVDQKPPVRVDILDVKNAKLIDRDKLTPDQRVFLQEKLNGHLGKGIGNNLGIPVEPVVRVLTDLDLDYLALADIDLRTLICGYVLPVLKTDPNLEKQLAGINPKTVGNTTKVGKILHLNQPIWDNPIFTMELKRAKVHTLARIAALDDDTANKLADKAPVLDLPMDSFWNDLVKDGLVTEKQRDALRFTFELAKLTEDNFKLVASLKAGGHTTTKAFISWEKEDWLTLFETNAIEPPENEIREKIAEKLVNNIENAHRSAFFMHRMAVKNRKNDLDRRIDDLTPLFSYKRPLFVNGQIAEINWGKIANRASVEKSIKQVLKFINRYKYLGFDSILNDPDLDSVEKKETIMLELRKLKTFYQNNAELDLHLINFFEITDSAATAIPGVRWDGISRKDRPALRKQLMSYQRMMNLAPSCEVALDVMGYGFDSAHAITNMTRDAFIKTASNPISADTAGAIYDGALENSMNTGHSGFALLDVTKAGIGLLNVGRLDPSVVNELRKIDGYEALFGPQNYCACDHCKSIFSPAAYFVDLMYFIEKNVTREVFAGDLAEDPLALKERRRDLWTLQLTCENTHTRIPYLQIVNEILEAYLLRLPDVTNVYDTLSNADNSIFLPFMRPLEELRLYLSHFELELVDILKVLGEAPEAIAREQLGFSQPEFEAVTARALGSVRRRFGNHVGNEMEAQSFLKNAGITRAELSILIDLSYLKEGGSITIRKEPEEEILRFIEIMENLTTKKLDRIHRFLRLWRRLPWSMQTLNLVLSTIKAVRLTTSLDQTAVGCIADLKVWQERFRFSVEELCALIGPIPNFSIADENPSLYERLFDKEEFFKGNRDIEFHHAFFNTDDPTDEDVDLKTPLLLAALSLSESELLHLLKILEGELGFDDHGNCRLARHELSLLFRHAKMAKALKLSVQELGYLIGFIFEPEDAIIYNLEKLRRLITVYDRLQLTPFTMVQLRLILKGRETENIAFKIDEKQIITLVEKVQADKTLYFTEKALVEIEGITNRQSKAFITTLTDQSLLIEEAELFRLSTHYSLSQDFTTAFDAMDADTGLRDKADAIRHFLNSFHPSARLGAYLGELFGTNQEALTAQSAFVQIDQTDNEFITALTTSIVDGVADRPEDLDILLDLVHELERLFLLSKAFGFDVPSLEFIAANPDLFDLSATESLSIQIVNNLAIYKRLLDLKENVAESVHQALLVFLAYQTDPGNGVLKSELVTLLCNLLGREQSLIQSLVENLRITDQPIEDLEQILACLRICDTLGINGHSLQKLAAVKYDGLQAGSKALLGAFKSKYEDEAKREEIIAPFKDRLNTVQRDTMCAFILGWEGLNFADMHELYNYFLIDVEMSGCERVSRVLAGISSLQLYIHRCRMNLEQDNEDPHVMHVLPECIPEDEWAWRKNYRVWEANRKVFVYPENYILPSERDIKTPLFKELEDGLLQQDITPEAAENAYRKYLAQLFDLSHLFIAGTYWHHRTNTLYLFGRTITKPYRYYYRKFDNSYTWTAWKDIDLNITSPHVSAIVHHGKLFLFWIDFSIHRQETAENGESEFQYYEYKFNLNYSYRKISGDWIQTQHFEEVWQIEDKGSTSMYGGYEPPNEETATETKEAFESEPFTKVYLFENNDKIHVTYYFELQSKPTIHCGLLSPYKNSFDVTDTTSDSLANDIYVFTIVASPEPDDKIHLGRRLILGIDASGGTDFEGIVDECMLDNFLEEKGFREAETTLITDDDIEKYNSNITIVHNSIPNRLGQFILRYDQQQYLLKSDPVRFADMDDVSHGTPFIRTYPFQLIPLSTPFNKSLSKICFTDNLEALLSLETQNTHDYYSVIPFKTDWVPWTPVPLYYRIDFNGPYGLYFQELYLHIPFLIASHLNATHKYEEAKKWYHYIFDPAAKKTLVAEKPEDRCWRYIEFREQIVEKLKNILADQSAIDAYKEAPFNAHAIARLRMNAYQKTIVMKYIDNLLDWGDHLFAQDTYESINEATMLYTLAADILGERPVQMGECKTAEGKQKTYETIGADIEEGSEFLIYLENWNFPYLSGGLADWMLSGGHGKKVSGASAVMDVMKQSILAFCIPPNETLLRYWDRVADRLFKIRHCMNISGVRRQLALYQPPIDPALLTRAREAGVSIEDILVGVDAELPPYRFAYLIEKAKSYAGTVQAFGSALLSALEKRDVEELSLLRSAHEQNILNLTTDIRKNRLEESLAQLRALYEAKKNVENREHHYSKLLTKDLIPWESSQQILKHSATALNIAEGHMHLTEMIAFLLPNVGSPFAMTYGGEQLGKSARAFAEWSRSMATVLDAMASSAGLEAMFARRREEWAFQVKLFAQEIKQIDEQIAAAEIRQAIAESEVEVHDKQIEQARAIYDFYKDKFTDLGLYTYIATTLGRLHREAYNSALTIAKMAERAYRFERDDGSNFIKSNWDTGKAGLLSGEKLLMQLQQMEQGFIQHHTRDYEVTQSFSMRQLDPRALLELKATSACNFKIPEIAYDLFYPGQYNRKIKSVRLTIPCVTGPYINVSCKLTLNKSDIRKEPEIGNGLEPIPEHCYQSVATSSANNDGGIFELNFQDPRYLPFEGAGAISEWKLELPSVLKPFDYQTISDVIFHISYTAKDNEQYRGVVQDALRESFVKYAEAEDHGVFRMFSGKYEFPDAWNHFLHGRNTEGDQELRLPITKNRFPFFVHDETIKVRGVEIFAICNVPIGEEEGLTYTAELTPLGSLTLSSHVDPEPTEMKQMEGIYHGQIMAQNTDPLWDIGEWKLKLKNDSGPGDYRSLPPDEIDDVILVVHYLIEPAS